MTKSQVKQAKAEHTPTPWKYSLCSKKTTTGNYSALINGNIYGGGIIAELPIHKHLDFIRGKTQMVKNRDNDSICEANAQFIVRAVNNHEKLVEALKKARVVLSLAPIHTDGVTGEAVSPLMKEIEQALKDCEE